MSDTSPQQPLRVEREGGVATLMLDRPDHLNALDEAMCVAIEAAFGNFESDPAVRAVLLCGAGRCFCAGGDVKQMRAFVESGQPSAFFEAPLEAINRALLAIASCRRPVIAALHGAVSGAGFNLALAADIRIASEEARFNQAFIRLGLVPDTGGTLSLPALCGPARAAELCFTGDFIDAPTAARWGIVNRIVPPDRVLEEARTLARRLAAGPAGAIARTKELLRRGWLEALSEQAERERRAQIEAGRSGDFAEGLRAFFEKRTPRFEDP
jgi:2-(1,2-epoxy-1,2-dihydrophenyl)acetyl-CoA isomerase